MDGTVTKGLAAKLGVVGAGLGTLVAAVGGVPVEFLIGGVLTPFVYAWFLEDRAAATAFATDEASIMGGRGVAVYLVAAGTFLGAGFLLSRTTGVGAVGVWAVFAGTGFILVRFFENYWKNEARAQTLSSAADARTSPVDT